MKDRLQTFVIRTSPWPPFRWLYAAVYAVGLAWLVLRLRWVREIRTLDVRVPGAGHCFGSSDLDMRAETEPLDTTEFFALADRLASVLLPGGTWRRIFDLYLFPQAEHELQLMVGAQSIARERRWVRVKGARAAASAPARAPLRAAGLGRAMLDHGAMSQALVEGPLGLHETRLLYGQFARIDAEHATASAADAVPVAELMRVRAAASPVRRGRVRRASFEELATAHGAALALASALGRTMLARASSSGRNLELTPAGEPSATFTAAVDACRAPLAALGAAAGGTLQSVVLGAVPGSRYEQRVYLVVRDGVPLTDHLALCGRLRELFLATNDALPYRFFRLRYPLLLTETLWRASGLWFHALRPVDEHFFLARHGVTLWGEPLEAPVPPDDATVRCSAALAVADLRNRIWGALHHRQRIHLADLLGGRVPVLWLTLVRGRIATTPAEAIEHCVALGMPDADALVALHALLEETAPRDLPPVDGPAWQPALAALPGWLDALVVAAADALRRPDSPSGAPSRETPG